MSRKPIGKEPVVLAMYIGPTMLRPVFLSHRSVYIGGIPEFAKDLAAKDPELAGCFIPLIDTATGDAGRALRELEGYPGTKPGEHTRRFRGVQKRYLESDQAENEKPGSKNRGTGHHVLPQNKGPAEEVLS